VVAVGPGARDRAGNLIPVSVKEGETVRLPEFGGTHVTLGDKEYVLLYTVPLYFALFLLSLSVRLLFSMFIYLSEVSFFCCFSFFGGFLACGFCAGYICSGMRISWALFMTD